MKASGKKLSELAAMMTVYPQVLKNAKVSNQKKYRFNENETISSRIKEIEEQFLGKGRVLIRPSGTEPLVRVMIEGENQAELEKVAIDLVQLIEAEMND